jgi:beta-carotene hydroxylase
MGQGKTSPTISRLVVCASVAVALGSFLWQPSGWLLAILDVIVRAYAIFIGTVMAHEASHGHLGRSRAANFWWGRLALLPSTVPFANFRRTHNLHHRHTNDPVLDPDHFVRPRRGWEIPLRAIAMPHHWYFWLRARGRVDGRHRLEVVLGYLATAAIFGGLVAAAGPIRVVTGLVPALVIVSLLLWYPFAIKTHEGWSLGAPETRSHDYYGRAAYWFSFGLSMHRAHHLLPALTWLQLRRHVKSNPARRPWRPARDVLEASR